MIQKIESGYVIGANQVWLPGVYESKRAARFAFRFNDEELQDLQDMVNKRAGGVGGRITLEDLRSCSRRKRV